MNRYWGNISLRLSFFLLVFLTCMAVGRVAAAEQLTLFWADASSNENGFKIERKTGTAGTYAQLAIAAVNTTTYLDSTLSNSTVYCYHVRAYNTAGDSGYSNEACGISTAPDTQFPAVSIAAPATGATVSGTAVTISANTSDNVGVVGVQFRLDGATLDSEDTTSPYSITWNSTTASNGSHALTAVARDAAGNTTTSTGVPVTVSNTAPPPPSTLGNTSIGGSLDSGDSNYLNGSRVTVGASSVTVNALRVYVGTVDAAPNNQYQVAIYTDLNGAPGTLVASSPAGSLTPNAWNTGPLGAALQVNTSYWLMYNTNGRTASVNNMYYNPGSAGQGAYSSNAVLFGNWPTTFGAVTLTNAVFSLSATTASSPPPPPSTYTLTVTKAGTGGGTVMATGISCGTDCSEPSLSGTAVTLTTTPNTGSTFAGWSGAADCSDGSVTMTANTTCTATFNLLPPTTYSLTVTKAGTGTGTVSGTGITCGADCSEAYTANTVVTLTAAPAAGSTFAGWSGAADCSDGSATMTANTTCTAMFNLLPPTTYSLTVTKAGTGTGTISGTGITCGVDCSEAYTANTVVTLTAAPAAGSTFAGWSGAADCSDGSVTISAATTCTATFTRLLNVKIGVFRPSAATWYLDLNGNGVFDGCTIDACPATFGISTDRPIVGDWTGIGTIQLGTFDPTTQMWELDRNGNDRWEDCTIDLCRGPFGQSSDLPMAGYWKTGMTKAGIGTFRPSTGKWYLDLNGNGKLDKGTTDARLGPFGTATDKPVVGNWAGNGITRIGVFTPSTGRWQLDLNGNGTFDGCTTDSCRGPFGTTGDLPVAGDWTGTGRTQIGVFTPANGQWKLDINGNGVFDGCTVDACLGSFGQTGDLPVVGKW